MPGEIYFTIRFEGGIEVSCKGKIKEAKFSAADLHDSFTSTDPVNIPLKYISEYSIGAYSD